MKTSWKVELPHLVLLTFMAALSAWAWSAAPERVPVHWNLQGEVDRFGSKAEGLILSPALAVGMYLLLLFLPRIDPGRANLQNSPRAYQAIRLSLTAFFAALHVVLVYSALGGRVSMNLFVGLSTATLFIVLGNFMSKLRPNWFAGVRTPWTLSSQLSWTKTHRAAGPVFMLMGVGMAVMAMVPRGWVMATVLTLDGLMLIGLVVYSYWVWRTDPNRVSPAGVTAAGE